MPATTPAVRAGDADREDTATLLGQALAGGYLGMADYETRLQTAFTAPTRVDLDGLTADLPVDQLRRTDPRRREARARAARRGVQVHLAAYLTMVVVVLTVWLAVGLTAGAWYFWPVWPILGAGIGVLAHALPVRYTSRPLPHHCGGRRQIAAMVQKAALR
ncbi:DUF1707 domain-containing protein [Mycobacterium sp. IDR2000157661]|uniref:DUF1707 domain-containing protein n=1 Tax=Mycobacterium sp. IDR2000157661 TaxID=2867005 RepID=UPI001EEB412C|nr:DUF1707 domain-containing protein [Mycobacterium sp. IDR2000157661]ULE34258.1 DUF1707 domain-containing protein [Mycobacterium sp. IDR2000157661]